MYLLLPRPSFTDVSIYFFAKNQHFFGKNSTLTKSNSMRALLEFFSSVFSFCKIKGYH